MGIRKSLLPCWHAEDHNARGTCVRTLNVASFALANDAAKLVERGLDLGEVGRGRATALKASYQISLGVCLVNLAQSLFGINGLLMTQSCT